MSLSVPVCPSCGEALTLTHQGQLDTWVCPAGHGLGATLSEAYDVVQEDELAVLWQLARQATPSNSARRCPICEQPMVSVEVPYDTDEAEEGASGDLDPIGSVWVDVCEDDQLIWFDAGELQAFPTDLADPEPSAAELEGAEKIRAAFGQSIVESSRARESGQLTERIYQRIARHKGLTRALTEVGSLGRR
jgi:Zn-finger nucleic acid-binding protein